MSEQIHDILISEIRELRKEISTVREKMVETHMIAHSLKVKWGLISGIFGSVGGAITLILGIVLNITGGK